MVPTVCSANASTSRIPVYNMVFTWVQVKQKVTDNFWYISSIWVILLCGWLSRIYLEIADSHNKNRHNTRLWNHILLVVRHENFLFCSISTFNHSFVNSNLFERIVMLRKCFSQALSTRFMLHHKSQNLVRGMKFWNAGNLKYLEYFNNYRCKGDDEDTKE